MWTHLGPVENVLIREVSLISGVNLKSVLNIYGRGGFCISDSTRREVCAIFTGWCILFLAGNLPLILVESEIQKTSSTIIFRTFFFLSQMQCRSTSHTSLIRTHAESIELAMQIPHHIKLKFKVNYHTKGVQWWYIFCGHNPLLRRPTWPALLCASLPT